MRNGQRYADPFQYPGNSILRFRIGERKQQCDGDCLGYLLLNFFGERLQAGWRRCMKNFAVARGAFVHPKPQIRGDKRLYTIKKEIVELGPGLAADLDGIFKPSGCDQRHARAFALQQSICADRGAMQKDC